MEILTSRMRRRIKYSTVALRSVVCALALALAPAVFAQPAGGQTAKPAPAAQQPRRGATNLRRRGSKDFFIHAFHAEKLGGLECSLCHTPVKEGSVVLKRPGHDQCMACHADDLTRYQADYLRAVPQTFPAVRRDSDLLPFPRYKSTRAILFQFSHAIARRSEGPH